MQVVINIDDKLYEAILDGWWPDINISVKHLIEKGTLLPKGHGDLIDRKDLIENGISKGFCDWYDEIKMADTIIEADTESEDKE